MGEHAFHKDLTEVVVAPTDFKPFVLLGTDPSCFFLLACVECNISQAGKVLGAMVFTNAGFIFSETNIKNSVEGVVDLPVSASGPK